MAVQTAECAQQLVMMEDFLTLQLASVSHNAPNSHYYLLIVLTVNASKYVKMVLVKKSTAHAFPHAPTLLLTALTKLFIWQIVQITYASCTVPMN